MTHRSIRLKLLFGLGIVLSFTYLARAQSTIPALRTYRITCDSAQFAYIISHYWEDRYLSCVFSNDSGVTLGAEIRIRGESSREYPKKSFKINFTAINRYENRDKINLISEWTDPSFVREYLSYDLFSRAGLLAPKVIFVKLFINGRYHGLYADVEQIDERFLEKRGLDTNAPLYKAAGNKTTLLPGEIEVGLWERQNGELTNYTELHRLIDWLAEVPDGSFFEGLGNRFDRIKLARSIAVNALIGNTSTYYHNYFLVRFRGEAGRWEYIPWDVDQTFKYSGAYSNPPYCRSGHQSVGTNELIRRCWFDPRMRQSILDQLEGITDSLFTQDYFSPLADSLRVLLRSAVASDTAKQFTLNDFLISTELIPGDVQGRGAKLRELVHSPPKPFDVIPAVITPNGVIFQWSPATYSDTDKVDYLLQVSREILFSTPEWGVSNLSTNHATLTDLPTGRLYWRVIARDETGRWLAPLHQFSVLDLTEFDRNAIEVPYLVTGTQRIRPGQGIYQATRDIIVEEGGVLEIERGVRIQFADSARLIVRGKLITVDAVGDSVKFEPVDPLTGWRGIEIEGNGGVELRMSSLVGGPDFPASGTITIRHSGSLKLVRCSIFHSTGCGIDALSNDPTQGTVLIEIDSSAIYAESGIYAQESNIKLSNSTFVGEQGVVQIDRGNKCLTRFENCRFYGMDWSLVMSGAHEPFISRCLFEEVGRAILSNSSTGAVRLSNSIFMRCEESVQSQEEEFFIWNCNFIDGQIGVTAVSSASVTICNSVFWLNNTNIREAPGSRISAQYCLSDQPLSGNNNILDSPQFEKPWDGDFTPEPNSPLIDAGLSDGAPTTDYFGRRRVNTSGQKNKGAGRYRYYDIGAVEYPTGEATPPTMDGRMITIYPNPVDEGAEIIFEIEIAGKAKLELFDITGRRVVRQTYDQIASGQYRVSVDELRNGLELSAGVYICRLEQPIGVSRTKMVVVR